MSRPVRSLIVDLSTRFGGTGARVLGLMASMPAGSITLATLEGSPVTEQARAASLDVHTVGQSKWDSRIGRRIAALARTVRADLIDVQNPQSKLWASRAAAALPIALVSTLNSWYLSEHGGHWKGHLYHRLETWTSRRLDLYIAVSREIEEQLLNSGVQPDQIALVENAIHADLTGPLPDQAITAASARHSQRCAGTVCGRAAREGQGHDLPAGERTTVIGSIPPADMHDRGRRRFARTTHTRNRTEWPAEPRHAHGFSTARRSSCR